MKRRYYRMIYWIGNNLVNQDEPHKSKNDAYTYLYDNEYKPLSVKFVGWK